MAHERDALITGIGLASCLGSGAEAHWDALQSLQLVLDTDSFKPFAVHPMAALNLDTQMPKKDQRQMENWQRWGVFAAGLALESAGVKGDKAILDSMAMIVAAGGGERDYAVDAAIMTGYPHQAAPDAWLNERLLSDIRPTLFLAQLSNLLAGNISIVHGVIGSSRTFMGEEGCGADAVRTAVARIASGQAEIVLVGGSYNAQRPDVLLHYEMGGMLHHGAFQPVWARQASGGGMNIGSVGAFLVIESRAHAEARGAAAYARVAAVKTDRCRRDPGQATANARAQVAGLTIDRDHAAVISGASGAAAATREEAGFLAELGLPVRAVATALGHSLEPAFPASLALAALSVRKGALFPPLEAAEAAMTAPLKQVLVTGWGHWRGEASALVEAA